MWDIIVWIVFGLIAGAIAKFIKPGTQGGGWIVTSILGIIGSVVGGFIGRTIFNQGVTNEVFSIYSLGLSVVGALIVLWIYGLLTNRRA